MGNQTSKITSCLIIKNEKDNIIPLVESLLKFSDEIMIADTGSTDGTLDRLMLFSGDDRVHLTFFDWTDNFAEARNFAFNQPSKYTSENDYFFWCDGDDIIDDNLVKAILELKKKNFENLSSVMLDYKYPDGNFLYLRHSFIRKHDFEQWVGIVHEYPCFSGRNGVKVIDRNQAYLYHDKEPGINSCLRNLKIFTNKYLIDKTLDTFSLRDLFYYGYEFYNNGMDEDAKRIFDILLEKGTESRQPEWQEYYFVTAITCIAEMNFRKQDLETMFSYLSKAMKYFQVLRADTSYYLGYYFREIGMFDKSRHYLNYCKNLDYKDYINNTFSNEEFYKRKALELLCNVYWCLEDNQASYESYKELKEKYPESKVIDMNKDWYRELKMKGEIHD